MTIQVLGSMLNVVAIVLPGVYAPASTFAVPNCPNVGMAKAMRIVRSRALNNFTIRNI
jgi:hypothetical protein